MSMVLRSTVEGLKFRILRPLTHPEISGNNENLEEILKRIVPDLVDSHHYKIYEFQNFKRLLKMPLTILLKYLRNLVSG